eukprot:632284-Prorocentrum_minimum.AAC.1
MDCYGFLPPSEEDTEESEVERFYRRRSSVKEAVRILRWIAVSMYCATPFVLRSGIQGWGPMASSSDRPVYRQRPPPYTVKVACMGVPPVCFRDPTLAARRRAPSNRAVFTLEDVLRKPSCSGYNADVSDTDMEQLARLVGAWKQLTTPYLSGLTNLPDPVRDEMTTLTPAHTF